MSATNKLGAWGTKIPATAWSSPASPKKTISPSSPKKVLASSAGLYSVPISPKKSPRDLSTKYYYVVQIPFYFDPTAEREVEARVSKACDMCMSWQAPSREVRVVVGLNAKVGSVALHTIDQFAARLALRPGISLVSFQWNGVPEKPGEVNYVHLRNTLFYHPKTLQMIGESINAASMRQGPSIVKVAFIDPDTTLASCQMAYAEMVWSRSAEFHLLSSAFYHFDLTSSQERVAFLSDKDQSVRWEGVLGELGSIHDYQTKQEFSSRLLTYTPLYNPLAFDMTGNPAHLSQMEQIANENFAILDSFGKGVKNPYNLLRNAYKTLLDTIALQKAHPHIDDAALDLRKKYYSDTFKWIIAQEYNQKRQLNALNSSIGEHVLYPTECAMVLTMFDGRHKVNIFDQIIKRRDFIQVCDLWGESNGPSGKGEGEKLLKRVSDLFFRTRSHAPYKLVDFTALTHVRTAMPPRFLDATDVRGHQDLPENMARLLQTYHSKQGFHPGFLDHLATRVMEKPQSSLQSKAFLQHRSHYVETRAQVEEVLRPAILQRMHTLVPEMHKVARERIVDDLKKILMREIYLFMVRNQVKADQFLLDFEHKHFSDQDKHLFAFFRTVHANLALLFTADQHAPRAVLGYLGY